MKNRDTPILENNVNSIAAYEPGGGAIAPQLWKVWGGGGQNYTPSPFFWQKFKKNWIFIIEAKTKKYCTVLCFETKRSFLLLQGFVIFGSV